MAWAWWRFCAAGCLSLPEDGAARSRSPGRRARSARHSCLQDVPGDVEVGLRVGDRTAAAPHDGELAGIASGSKADSDRVRDGEASRPGIDVGVAGVAAPAG